MRFIQRHRSSVFNGKVRFTLISEDILRSILWMAAYCWIFCSGAPQLCYEGKHHDNITAAQGNTGNITVCIFSHCLNHDCLKVFVYQQTHLASHHDLHLDDNQKKNDGLSSDRFQHTWIINETIPNHHWLHLEIYNITQGDYGVWNVVISSNGKKNLSFSIIVLTQNDQTGVSFKYRSIKASNELSVTLKCMASEYPKALLIKRQGDSRALSTVRYNRKNYQKRLSLDYEISPAQCSDMTTYQCVVTRFNGLLATLDTEVPIEKCPIRLCIGQQHKFTVQALLNDTVNVTICVVAFPRLLNTLLVNNVSHNISGTDWLEVYKNGSDIHHYIRITRRQVSMEDFKNYTVQIFSLFNNSIAVNFELVKKEKQNSDERNLEVLPTCKSNITSLCILYYSKSRMQLYIRRQYYGRYSLVNISSKDSKYKHVTLIFGNSSLNETETFVLEIWHIRQHERENIHLNGGVWTHLGLVSGLSFCCHHGLTLSWAQLGQDDHHRGQHAGTSSVALTQERPSTDCHTLHVNVNHHETHSVHHMSLSISVKEKIINVTDTISDTVDVSELPHHVIIIVISVIICIAVICLSVVMILIVRTSKGRRESAVRKKDLELDDHLYDTPLYNT